MNNITIFGEQYTIDRQQGKADVVKSHNKQLIIKTYKKKPLNLLKCYLEDRLYNQLSKIFDHFRKNTIVDIFGEVDFAIVDNIEGKQRRIAKIQGHKIQIKLNTVILPIEGLQYIIAHEIAHTVSPRHTNRFWKYVESVFKAY